MPFPPQYPINTPVNMIYHIPIQTLYGNGVPIPPNSPATLDIDCNGIRGILSKNSCNDVRTVEREKMTNVYAWSFCHLVWVSLLEYY